MNSLNEAAVSAAAGKSCKVSSGSNKKRSSAIEDEESKANNKIRSPQTTDTKATKHSGDIKSSQKKADLGFERPYQRPTSPNTPHLT